MPHPTTDDDVNDTPVNVAPPNWQCPHCRTQYGPDLESATECAQAGPAADVTEGTPVLILAGPDRGMRSSRPVFGLTEVGPIRVERTDTGRRHRRDVVIAGTRLNADRLTDARPGHDGLLVLADDRHRDPDALLTAPNLNSFGTVTRLFLRNTSYGSYSDPDVTVWVDEPAGYVTRDAAWWNAPDDDQRAALNVVTAGLLDKIVETDEADLLTKIRIGYQAGYRAHRAGQQPADLAEPAAGLMLAQAHGAPNHIWALRWLTAHLDAVATWQTRTLRAWAAGEGGPLPGGTTLRVADALPNNPGKRRLLVMEPYGDTYREVRDAVMAQLTTDAPTSPIPDVEDVDTVVRTTKARN